MNLQAGGLRPCRKSRPDMRYTESLRDVSKVHSSCPPKDFLDELQQHLERAGERLSCLCLHEPLVATVRALQRRQRGS